MAEQPLTLAALAKFHREVVVPDIARAVQASVDGLRAEMNAGFDAIYQRLERIETEYHMLVVGLKRIEERLDRVEQRLDRVEAKLDKLALRSELVELKSRVDTLQEQVRTLEARLED